MNPKWNKNIKPKQIDFTIKQEQILKQQNYTKAEEMKKRT